MPAKAPIYLKPTNSKKGKKGRLRDILSPDMISPPLGDFRHTVHIGKGGGGDAFGDMSFLQGKYELIPGKGDPQHSIQSELMRANSTGNAGFAETPSPVLKNAISLPTIGGCQALTLPLISPTVFSMSPEPLGGSEGPPSPTKVEMDALLHSIDVFSSETPSSFNEMYPKPDVLLHLLENRDKPKAGSKPNKPNKSNNGEIPLDVPTLYYINNQTDIYKVNGSSDRFDSFSLNDRGFQSNILNNSRHLNNNGNCNSYGHFDQDITHGFEFSMFNGDSVDRDSGVEEGRISDYDFELSQGKRMSQESLTQITGSLLSLELDLGPSILDDVLNIMDKAEAKNRP